MVTHLSRNLKETRTASKVVFLMREEAYSPRNVKKPALISSNRVSLPVFKTRKRRKPAIRTAQTITKTLTTTLRVWKVLPMRRVRRASRKKLEPNKNIELRYQQREDSR